METHTQKHLVSFRIICPLIIIIRPYKQAAFPGKRLLSYKFPKSLVLPTLAYACIWATVEIADFPEQNTYSGD